MSATTKTWVNGLAPTCEDDDLNGFKNENNNLIIGSGQGISTADNQQTHKAVAHYAGVGDFYVDSGTANSYVLSVTGVQAFPPTYATGMRIRFVAGNANTGASTVNVAGLGVKSMVWDVDGSALTKDQIPLNASTEAYYDGTNFRVLSDVAAFRTFTPGLYGATSGTGTRPTYSAQLGTYVKKGNMVFFEISVNISAIGGVTGDIRLDGFPFDINNVTGERIHLSQFRQISGATLTAGRRALRLFPVGSGDPDAFDIVQRTAVDGASGDISLTDTNLSAPSFFQVEGFYTI